MPVDVLGRVTKGAWRVVYVQTPNACTWGNVPSASTRSEGPNMHLPQALPASFNPLQSLECTHTLPAVSSGVQLFLELLPGDLSLLVPEQ